MRITRREKVFGPGRAVPLDRNAKVRISAYAKARDRRYRQPGQRGGALGRAALDVLSALLWVFHNASSGCCFPSYERIAEKAGCARSTVAEAIKILSMGGEKLDTRKPTSKLMLTILAGVATWEREIMLERQREGIAKAKAAGKYKGRPPSVDRAKIKELLTQMGPAAVAKTMGIARSTVYKLGFDA